MKVIIVILTVLLSGCALFQKTKKHTVEEKQELQRQTELRNVAIKTGQKETNVYTYWTDGSVYQWQNSVEQVGEVSSTDLSRKESRVSKTDKVAQQQEPARFWMYAACVLFLIGSAWIYRIIK